MNDLWELVAVVLTLFVLAQSVAILALARAIGLLQIRLGPEPAALQTANGLAVGVTAPPIPGFEVGTQREATLKPSLGRWLFVFLTTTCSLCRVVARDAANIAREPDWGATIVLVVRGTREQAELLRALAPNVMTFVDEAGDAHKEYRIDDVPQAFLVVDGRIEAKGIVNHRDQLELLLQGQTRKLPEPAWVPLADTAIRGNTAPSPKEVN